MRIALVHSFYSSDVPSGENAIVLEQAEALTEAGHAVRLIARRTDEDRQQALYALRSAGRIITGRGPDPTAELEAFRPDLVHVHNLFPNFGTRWLREWRGPVVATLHNFRPLCANGLLFRDGSRCEECPTRSHLSGVRHQCYHDSRVATIPLAVRNARGPLTNDVLARADVLICPSDHAARMYRRLASDSLPIAVIPHGLDIPSTDGARACNDRWLVVGRLTPEKGVRELVAAWPSSIQLDIIGSGPEGDEIRKHAGPHIRVLGSMPREHLLQRIPSYTGLVFPSKCDETQGLVLVEAMASGIPIVAAADNAGGELVQRHGLGGTYSDSAELAAALVRVTVDREALGQNARAVYESNYTRRAWVERLQGVYSELTIRVEP
jgi:glycosyltransferase involved in cell wall biosynthesis